MIPSTMQAHTDPPPRALRRHRGRPAPRSADERLRQPTATQARKVQISAVRQCDRTAPGRRAVADDDAVEPEPAGHQARARRRAAAATRPWSTPVLGAGRTAPAAPAGPVGLEVDPGHEPVAEQERQHVVAVDPLRRRACRSRCGSGSRRAARCAVALPDQRVERRQQRPGPDPARERGPRDPGRPGSVQPSTATGSELAGGGQLRRAAAGPVGTLMRK